MIPMFYNYNYFPMFYPFLPPNCDKPPTLYSVLNSIVNGEKDEDDYTKIKDLAKEGRRIIFNFEYPLTNNITKEKFETIILNKFLMRRIGFETVTAFRIQLDVKLNEIMPKYNKLFDALENWDIFNDGETIERKGEDNTITNSNNELTNTSINNTENVSDRRNSNTPQNQLENVRNGSYVTNYDYDTDNVKSNDSSNSKGTSNTENSNNYWETIRHSPSDKIKIFQEMQENINNIYTLIFNDLEDLFYSMP